MKTGCAALVVALTAAILLVGLASPAVAASGSVDGAKCRMKRNGVVVYTCPDSPGADAGRCHDPKFFLKPRCKLDW